MLDLRLLGEMTLYRDGELLTLPPSKRTRALLAYLAVTGRRHRRDQLCSLLWERPDDPRGALRWSLSKLRQLVDDTDHRRIVADRASVTLDATDLCVDLAMLRAASTAQFTSASTERSLELASLFRGEFLQGLDLNDCDGFQAWCVAERQEARIVQARLLETLIPRLSHSAKDALPHARVLANLDASHVENRVRLLQLLCRDSRRDEAGTEYAASRVALEALGGEAAQELKNAWRDMGKSGAMGSVTKAITTGDDISANASASGKPSIAVLPFDNMSDEPAQEHFADGITEDIITDLARFRWFFVIARNSSFTYKGAPVDISQVARELGVRYVLEGSVRKAGNRVRVTAQLIDAPNAVHIWAERFDRDLVDIFQIQEEIAHAIAAAIEPELASFEDQRVRAKPPETLDAWESYQTGVALIYTFSRDGLEDARQRFSRAIALDSGFAAAHARLAYVHVQKFWYDAYELRDENLDRAFAAAEQALLLDANDPYAHLALGRAYGLRGPLSRAIAELETAINLNPSLAQAYHALAQALYYADRPREALTSLDTAMLLSPRDPHIWTFLHLRALAYYRLGELEKAEENASAATRQTNAAHWAFATLAAVLGRAGKQTDATAAASELLRRKPRFKCATAKRDLAFIESRETVDRYLEELRMAGLPE